MNTRLTIEESARLIKLGVDEKLASEIEYRPKKSGYGRLKYRVYSLADILSILPKEIKVDKVILSLVIEWQGGKWYACYMGHGYMKADHSAPELIDALYQLAIWCLENNHIKTEKK